MTLGDVIGSIGVFLLLLAFALNGVGQLSHASINYQGLNAIGAGLACYASILIDYLPFVILEGAWCAVALAAIARLTLMGAVREQPNNLRRQK